jgi:purine-binding chemotaxis protein CheW
VSEQVVVVQLGSECYGLDIAKVQEIRVMSAGTGVPMAPAYVDGVVSMRGRVTPVIDLRTLFGKERTAHTCDSRIVVVDTAGQWVGLVVDAVIQVIPVQSSEVERAAELATTVDSESIRGIAYVGDMLVIMLDLDSLFATTGNLLRVV